MLASPSNEYSSSGPSRAGTPCARSTTREITATTILSTSPGLSMSEIWQTCIMCQGRGGKEEERAALYTEPGFNQPQIRTVTEWIACGTCLGMGRMRGGTQ